MEANLQTNDSPNFNEIVDNAPNDSLIAENTGKISQRGSGKSINTDISSVGTDDDVWERMVAAERKQLAAQRGVRVADIEEEALLDQAVRESRLNDVARVESERDDVVHLNERLSQLNIESSGSQSINSNATIISMDPSHVEGNDSARPIECDEDDDYNQPDIEQAHLNTNNKTDVIVSNEGTEDFEYDSIWYKLPQELSSRILILLGDPDMCGYLSMVAKTNPFLPSSAVYEDLCRMIYTRQLGKNALFNIERFGSWKNMIMSRPRLRMNGLYFLRTIFSKAPCNDNFWEPRRSEFIEVKMYRHLRFFMGGYVLYYMDVKDPWDVEDSMEKPSYQRIFEGRYKLHKNIVTVEIFMHYCILKLELSVKNGDDGYIGNHIMLHLRRHTTIDLQHSDRYLYELIYGSNGISTIGVPWRTMITRLSQSNPNVTLLLDQDTHRMKKIEYMFDKYNSVTEIDFHLPDYKDFRFHRVWQWNGECDNLTSSLEG